MKCLKILAFTRYDRLGASSRLRFYQYADFLNEVNFDLTFKPFFDNDYVSSLYSSRVSRVGVLCSYWKRLFGTIGLRKFDVLWVEKELLPWIPSWIELAIIPRHATLVVDYDDAWFHRYDRHPSRWVRALLGNKIDRVMARADLVIVGNEYLAQRARDAGARCVRQLPTVVDLDRYPPISRDVARLPLVVGWMGSPSTAKYLEPLFPVADRLCREHLVRFVAVGATTTQVWGSSFEVAQWSEEGESSMLGSFDIGIMPLPDEDWERGKCGYKLIQYMASGLPVVASPVGINTCIVAHGGNGFLADSTEDWYQALNILLTDALRRERFGAAGRNQVKSSYCLLVTAPMLRDFLVECIRHKGE
jgi:glycosyltransferase involved in cell wall biosynthesis